MTRQPIHADEAAELMTVLTVIDRWLTITEQTATVWAATLTAQGIRIEDAREAAGRLVGTRQAGAIAPKDLIDEARRYRSERVGGRGELLVMPQEIPDGAGRDWRIAARDALVDGHTVRDAELIADRACGVRRREIGPPARGALRLVGRSA